MQTENKTPPGFFENLLLFLISLIFITTSSVGLYKIIKEGVSSQKNTPTKHHSFDTEIPENQNFWTGSNYRLYINTQ